LSEVLTSSQRRTHSYAVWEITLKCNLACGHCGSRAGDSRVDELSTDEALDLVRQMAEAGIDEVTLIGGEAFLRRDWLQIAQAISDCGMAVSMTTGGYGIGQRTAERMKEAGLTSVSVSVDGLEATHDKLRGKEGSWKRCFETISHVRNAGIYAGANSQINRLSAPEFPMLYEALYEAGIKGWQWSMTVPMGNAADYNEMLLQPAEFLDVFPMLAAVASQARLDGVQVQPGNNVGYYGPYEALLRNSGDAQGGYIWQGCQAGMNSLGIEADGAIKGCPSLPTKAYTGGNIRDYSLVDIVNSSSELNFNNHQSQEEAEQHLWGFCKTCDFAPVCRGGCSWTSHVFFDRRGNNPYCHHRALIQADRGLRERVKQVKKAEGNPFDNGLFEIIEEPLDTPWPQEDKLHFRGRHIQWPARWDPVRIVNE
jgi:nif11-class peptide radical SAM maturase 3